MGIEELREKVNSKFGKDVMFSPAQDLGIRSIPRSSSGSLRLDIAVGGGWPGNRIIEIYGPESTGKTFLLYKAIAEVTNRKDQNKAMLIDEEGSYDSVWGKKCGILEDNLQIVRGDYAEQTLDIMEMAVQSGDFSLIGLDSIASLIPKEELDASTEDWQMALLARLMSKCCRKMFRAINSARRKGGAITIIFINQIRYKVGRVFGNPETTPGGMGVKFAASVRVDVRKEEFLKEGSEVYAQRVWFNLAKNKTAPPFRFGTFDFYVGGTHAAEIDNHRAVFDFALDMGLIVKSGSWFDGGLLPKKLQGEEKVVEFLRGLKTKELNDIVKKIETTYLGGKPLAFRF